MRVYLLVLLSIILVMCSSCQKKQKYVKNKLVTNEISSLVLKWDLVKGTSREVKLYHTQFNEQKTPDISSPDNQIEMSKISPAGQRTLSFCVASEHLFEGKKVLLVQYRIEGIDGDEMTYETFDKVLLSQNKSGSWRVVPPKIWRIHIEPQAVAQ